MLLAMNWLKTVLPELFGVMMKKKGSVVVFFIGFSLVSTERFVGKCFQD